jgi:hypothetical protein
MSGTVPLVWAHPGDIQAGPDGQLYILNNGPGDAALIVIGPDGSVARSIPLNGTSPVRRGLQITDDGSIYVSDTIGGFIARYNKDGGNPVATWHGQAQILNNPADLWVGQDGSVFTSESAEQILHLDAAGQLLQLYKTGCSTYYYAQSPLAPEWLDMTCTHGVRSIHLPDGVLRYGQIGGPPGGTALSTPLALAYAPDGRLYMFDGLTLVEYKVTH